MLIAKAKPGVSKCTHSGFWFPTKKNYFRTGIRYKASTRQIPETRTGLITTAFPALIRPLNFWYSTDIIYFAKSLAISYIRGRGACASEDGRYFNAVFRPAEISLTRIPGSISRPTSRKVAKLRCAYVSPQLGKVQFNLRANEEKCVTLSFV